jgi:hypothetical protein
MLKLLFLKLKYCFLRINDRLFPTSNSDRTLNTHKPERLNLNNKQRSPLTTHKLDRLSSHKKSDRHRSLTKPDLQNLEQIVMSTSISRAKLDESV